MAIINPFRGWRYNPQVVGDVKQMISPLLDAASASQINLLYQNEANSIHVSVPKTQAEASEKLAAWKHQAILVQDTVPAIYVYYQKFRLPNEDKYYTRRGFLCMLRIQDEAYNDMIIHENTLVSNVNERVHFLEKTRMNFIPTHSLYEDASFELEAMMDEYMQQPLMEYDDNQQVKHSFALLTKKEDIAFFQHVLKDKILYLADGHHRWESAKVFRKQLKEAGMLGDDDGANYHFTYLSNLCADDLRILPTHRIWRPTIDGGIEKWLQNLDTYFTITDISGSPTPLYEYLREKKYAFGLLHKEYEYVIELRKELNPRFHISLSLCNEAKDLSYTVLHYFVFEKVGFIPYHRQANSPVLRYEKSYSQAVREALKGAYSFICTEVSLSEMIAVCQAGATMPPKVTYFYPKVVCGFVFAGI